VTATTLKLGRRPDIDPVCLLQKCDDIDLELSDIRIWSRALVCEDPNMEDYWQPPIKTDPSLFGWFPFLDADPSKNFAPKGMAELTKIRGAKLTSDGPINAHAECRFRNPVVFDAHITKVTADGPAAGLCDKRKGTSQLTIEWNPDVKKHVTDSCVYLSGSYMSGQSNHHTTNSTLPTTFPLPLKNNFGKEMYPHRTFDIKSSPNNAVYSEYLDQKGIRNCSAEKDTLPNGILLMGAVVKGNLLTITMSGPWEIPWKLRCRVSGSYQSYCVAARTNEAGKTRDCEANIIHPKLCY
jgi:hypothetical protein